ncbi:hypothetical protein BH23GEM4_BH23GEM4_09260 [soil metagenome]
MHPGTKPIVLAAVIVFTAACEDRRPAPEPDRSAEQLSRIANDSIAAVAEGTAAGLVTPDTARGARAFTFEPMAGAAMSGTGTAAPEGNATQLILNLTGAPENERLRAVVNSTPCPGSGDPIATIDPIVAGPTGNAESVSMLTTAPATVLNGKHSVRMEVRTSGGLQPAACANIPAAAMPPARP